MNTTTYKNKYNNASTGLFKDNTTGDIGADDARTLVTDTGDNFLNFDDDVLDEDDMLSNSATQVPTQQSVKAYVDAAALGIVSSWKAPVAVATTANITLSGEQTIDGILTSASRILVKNQTAQSENGIYLTAAGAWARSSDANTAAELEGVAVMVQQGTTNANTTWIQTTDGITLGSSNIVWSAIGTTVPDADATTKGIAKLYTTPDGTNTDGAVSQAGINSKLRALRTVTGASASVQADDNKLIILNSATPFNFTLDQLTADTKISFINYGAGAVTFVNGAGVTLAGSAVLPGATGTTYPSCLVVYDTLTTPRIISGTSKIDLNVPSVVGGTITLDCNNQVERMFVGSGSFGTAKAIALSNTTNALVINIVLTLTNVAAVLTFPSTFTMQLVDSRWNDGAKTFTPSTTGKHEFSATWDGTDWNMKVTTAYA